VANGRRLADEQNDHQPMRITGASDGGLKSTAGDEADEKSNAEGTQHAFRGVLADVVFGGRVKFLRFHAGFLPVFGG
jgi:hypothetical protein